MSGTKLESMSKSPESCNQRKTLEEYMKKLVALGVIKDSELKEFNEEAPKRL